MAGPDIQKIVVYISPKGTDFHLVPVAESLASKFRKELLLLSLASSLEELKTMEEMLQHYLRSDRPNIPGIRISSTVLIRPGRNLARILADDMEAIMLVAAARHFRMFSGHLRRSPVPFMFLHSTQEIHPEFKRIIIPVDMRRQMKDALLWSLFFGRNNQSEVIAVGANDRSKEGRHQVNSHLNALKRLFIKSGVPHKIYKGARSSLSIQQEAFETAPALGADLMILLGSSYVTLLDRILGLPEEKIIRKAGNLPVLVVNPRRETYLVCE